MEEQQQRERREREAALRRKENTSANASSEVKQKLQVSYNYNYAPLFTLNDHYPIDRVYFLEFSNEQEAKCFKWHKLIVHLQKLV